MMVVFEGEISAFRKEIQAVWLGESVCACLGLELGELVKIMAGGKALIWGILAGSVSG
jgi:hypothetical protein